VILQISLAASLASLASLAALRYERRPYFQYQNHWSFSILAIIAKALNISRLGYERSIARNVRHRFEYRQVRQSLIAEYTRLGMY